MTELDKQLEVLDHRFNVGLFTENRFKRYSSSDMIQDFFTFNPPSSSPSNTTTSLDDYIGIHQRNKESGKAIDVPELKTLVIDVDPVRPKGEGSTDEQEKEAIELAEKIAMDFSTKYPECFVYVVGSGSGAHVYIPVQPIKVTNYKNLTKSLKKWSDGIKKYYEKSSLKIDSIFDLSRVIRAWGSFNNKSKRWCRLLSKKGTKRAKIHFDQTDAVNIIVQGSVSFTGKIGLRSRFNLVAKSNPVLLAHMNKSASYTSRSESDYAFIGALLKSGFNVPEIKILAKMNPLGRQSEIKEEDIERVTEKFISNGLKVKSTHVYANKYFSSLNSRQAGIPIGIASIDRATGGLRADVTIISARPGNGKTSLMCQMARNLCSQGKRVLLFPTELGIQPIYDKIMAQISGVYLEKFRDGTFTKEDKDAIEKAKDQFSKLPLVVVEDFGLTLQKIIKMVNEIEPDILMLDYIQSMKFKEGGLPYEIAAAMQGLTDIAGTHNIPVVVASQLSRPSDVSQIDMSHLKGSGALEEKARVVQALTVLDKYASPRPVDLLILKNSYGETGKFPLSFNQHTGNFTDGRS